MPHFVIDCSPAVLTLQPAETLIREVHDTAESTGLFGPGDIKVRVNVYALYSVGRTNGDFIHVFGYIMEGRTTEQKQDLSKRIIRNLTAMFPQVPVISMNVTDFEKATYCNRTMI